MNAITWVVPANHPAFAGHFPNNPIVPGVVLLDQAILAAGEILNRSMAGYRIGSAKFFSPVRPGEVLTFSFEEKGSGAIHSDIRTADRDVASITLAQPKP